MLQIFYILWNLLLSRIIRKIFKCWFVYNICYICTFYKYLNLIQCTFFTLHRVLQASLPPLIRQPLKNVKPLTVFRKNIVVFVTTPFFSLFFYTFLPLSLSFYLFLSLSLSFPPKDLTCVYKYSLQPQRCNFERAKKELFILYYIT